MSEIISFSLFRGDLDQLGARDAQAPLDLSEGTLMAPDEHELRMQRRLWSLRGASFNAGSVLCSEAGERRLGLVGRRGCQLQGRAPSAFARASLYLLTALLNAHAQLPGPHSPELPNVLSVSPSDRNDWASLMSF